MPIRTFFRFASSPSSVETSGLKVRKSFSMLKRKFMRNHLPIRIAGCCLNSKRKYFLAGFSLGWEANFLSSGESSSSIAAGFSVAAVAVFLAFFLAFFLDVAFLVLGL